jgi:hypothetical protein
MKNRKHDAYTFLNLLAVIAIIAILSTVCFPTVAHNDGGEQKATSSEQIGRLSTPGMSSIEWRRLSALAVIDRHFGRVAAKHFLFNQRDAGPMSCRRRLGTEPG